MTSKNLKEPTKKVGSYTEKEKKLIKKEYDRNRYLKKKIQKEIDLGNAYKYDFIFKPVKAKEKIKIVDGKEQKTIVYLKTKRRLQVEKAFFGLVQNDLSISKQTIFGVVEIIKQVRGKKKQKKSLTQELLEELKIQKENEKNPYYEHIYFESFNDFFRNDTFINYNGVVMDKKHFMFSQRNMIQKFPMGFLYYRLGVKILTENETVIHIVIQDREQIIKTAVERKESQYLEYFPLKNEGVISTNICFYSSKTNK